mmetsp:Transcript_26239/g.56926  ORF Transcript_26239/g.56926 Transcript_26239/m.56926 type:complete len:255 (+) Transcript_26239:413-1177(+)
MRASVPTISLLAPPQSYCGVLTVARILTLSPTLRSPRTISNSEGGAVQFPSISGNLMTQSPSLSRRSTRPTMPCLASPQPYFGVETSARIRTSTPGWIAEDEGGVPPSKTSMSSTAQIQRSWFSNFTTASPSSSKAITSPTSACFFSDAQPCLGLLTVALKRILSPTAGRRPVDSSTTSTSSRAQTHRSLVGNFTTGSSSESKERTSPMSSCFRSEAQPCLGEVTLALKRTLLPTFGADPSDPTSSISETTPVQ